MPMRRSLDLDRAQRALARWVEAAVADEPIAVRWAGQPYPRPGERRWALLNLSSPPSPRQVDHAGRLVTLPSGALVTLAGTFAAGQHFRLVVNRYPYPDHVAVAPNDPTAVATALAALVAAGPEPVVASVGPGPGALTLAPAQPGDLQSAALVPASMGTVAATGTQDVFVTGGSRSALLSVTVFAPLAVGPLSADQVAADLITHLSTPPVRRLMRDAGLGVWSVSAARDVSALQGTELERAVQFDVRLGMRARIATNGTSIDTVELLRTAAGITRTITIPQP